MKHTTGLKSAKSEERNVVLFGKIEGQSSMEKTINLSDDTMRRGIY